MAAIYDVLELSTAVKPWLLRHLLDGRGLERVAYLDPDIRVYDRLDEIERLTGEHGLVLIPHITSPLPRDGKRPSEADILISGTYNLGFISLEHGSATDGLLDWWSERLKTDCVVAPDAGYFVDQRWMDFVHGVMPDYFVLRDPSYNVAYWNLHGRELTYHKGRYFVDGRPLRFFHFSGFDPDHRKRLSAGPRLQCLRGRVARPRLQKGEELALLLRCSAERRKARLWHAQALSQGRRGGSPATVDLHTRRRRQVRRLAQRAGPRRWGARRYTLPLRDLLRPSRPQADLPQPRRSRRDAPHRVAPRSRAGEAALPRAPLRTTGGWPPGAADFGFPCRGQRRWVLPRRAR